MSKRISSFIVCFFLLLSCTIAISIKINAAEKISWDKSEKTEVVDGNNRYLTYFSSNGKYSWIYKIEQVEEKEMESLELPETIEGAIVKKIGYEDKSDSDDVRNLLGVIVEPYHNIDGSDVMPKGIKKVSIPSTVTEICGTAFCGFYNLEEIEIPDEVTTLKYALFYGCSSLKRIVLPKKLEKIENDVFRKCKNLKEFSISKDSKKYCCVDNLLLSKDKKSFIKAPTGLKKVSIPSTVTKIARDAFLDTNVKKVFIPESVTSFQKNSLSGKKIQEILISPDNKLYAVEEDCIYKKKNGELIAIINRGDIIRLPKQVRILTNRVSTIGKDIENLIIPKTVKELRKNCFHYGIRLKTEATIYFEASTPPKMEKGSCAVFATYFVPEKSLQKYKKRYHKVEKLPEGEKEYTIFVGY